MKFYIGIAMPSITWLSLIKKNIFFLPIPVIPYSKFGLKKSYVKTICKILVKLRVPLCTWGGRLYDELADMNYHILYFEDGFHRSDAHWSEATQIQNFNVETSGPYFIDSPNSRLVLAIKAAQRSELKIMYHEEVAFHKNAIEQGRGKYGTKAQITIVEPVPSTITAQQTANDFQILLSPNFNINYENFRKVYDSYCFEHKRLHPSKSGFRDIDIGTFKQLQNNGLRNLIVFNSGASLEALVSGVAVTFYGDHFIKYFLNSENVTFPVTVMPTEELIEEVILACYIVYPI